MAAAGLVLLASCAGVSVSRPVPAEAITPETLRNAGAAIDSSSASESYLRLIASREEGVYGPVVVFIERHNSRLIQAEIALGMYRLSRAAGLKRIAREGMFEGETLAGHELPAAAGVDRRHIALNFLERGELGAAEFMFLAENSSVFGVEREDEYGVTLTEAEDIAFQNYLLGAIIADAGWERAGPLIHTLFTPEDEGQWAEANAALWELSPWAQETAGLINTSLSTGQIITRLEELRGRCEALVNLSFNDQGQRRVFIDDRIKDDFAGIIGFYENVRQRSITMAGNVLQTLKNENGPLAMVIGANHTEDVELYFDEHGVRYYVLEPKAIWDAADPSNISDAAYERRSEGKPLAEPAALANFLGIELMPRPLLSETWIKKQAAVQGLILSLSNAMETNPGEAPLYGLSAGDLSVAGVRILPESIRRQADGSTILAMENEGQILYFRFGRSEGYNAAGITSITDIETALTAMIERLSQIQKGAAYPVPVAAFNLPASNIICVAAPSLELINQTALLSTI
jgi:hypothetical protein